MICFFNSSVFIALATFAVGIFAYIIYTKQKRDYKRDAANIILMEIRHAEKVVEQMKMGSVAITNTTKILLPTNNWIRYNYLFIKDFDRDELDLINNFYNQCSSIDSGLSQMSISKQLEQKGSSIQNTLAQIAKDSISKADFDNKKKNFLDIIVKENCAFYPDAPRSIINQGLNNLTMITTSTIGNKLKKIAKFK